MYNGYVESQKQVKARWEHMKRRAAQAAQAKQTNGGQKPAPTQEG